jgi:hypothetical protein
VHHRTNVSQIFGLSRGLSEICCEALGPLRLCPTALAITRCCLAHASSMRNGRGIGEAWTRRYQRCPQSPSGPRHPVPPLTAGREQVAQTVPQQSKVHATFLYCRWAPWTAQALTAPLLREPCSRPCLHIPNRRGCALPFIRICPIPSARRYCGAPCRRLPCRRQLTVGIPGSRSARRCPHGVGQKGAPHGGAWRRLRHGRSSPRCRRHSCIVGGLLGVRRP